MTKYSWVNGKGQSTYVLVVFFYNQFFMNHLISRLFKRYFHFLYVFKE